jgi:hypothetical protein
MSRTGTTMMDLTSSGTGTTMMSGTSTGAGMMG